MKYKMIRNILYMNKYGENKHSCFLMTVELIQDLVITIFRLAAAIVGSSKSTKVCSAYSMPIEK